MAELTQADFDSLKSAKDKEIRDLKRELEQSNRRTTSLERQVEDYERDLDRVGPVDDDAQPAALKQLISRRDATRKQREDEEARGRANRTALLEKAIEISEKYTIPVSELKSMQSVEEMQEHVIQTLATRKVGETPPPTTPGGITPPGPTPKQGEKPSTNQMWAGATQRLLEMTPATKTK